MTLRSEPIERIRRAVADGRGFKLSAYELKLLWPLIETSPKRWWEVWRWK